MAKKKSYKKSSEKITEKAPKKIIKKKGKTIKPTVIVLAILSLAIIFYGVVHAIVYNWYEGMSLVGLVVIVWIIIKIVSRLLK